MPSLKTYINKVLSPTGYAIARANQADMTALHRQRLRLSQSIAKGLDYVTRYGPFEGLRLAGDSHWSAGDTAIKLLGLYEQDLFPAVRDQIARRPDCIINIGAGDGYYAVGLKRLLPQSHVIAYDIDQRAALSCLQTAQVNNVAIDAKTAFSVKDLTEAARRYQRVFVVMDCEGCESQLLHSEHPSCFRRMSFLIECHDGSVPHMAARLAAKFDTSHNVDTIREGPRNPHALPELDEFGSFEKALICCEFRGKTMTWLYATPRAKASHMDSE